MLTLFWIAIICCLMLSVGGLIGYFICIKTVVKEKEIELKTILKESMDSIKEKPFGFCPLCNHAYRK